MKRNGTLSCGGFEFPGLDVPGLSGRPVPPAGFKGRRPAGRNAEKGHGRGPPEEGAGTGTAGATRRPPTAPLGGRGPGWPTPRSRRPPPLASGPMQTAGRSRGPRAVRATSHLAAPGGKSPVDPSWPPGSRPGGGTCVRPGPVTGPVCELEGSPGPWAAAGRAARARRPWPRPCVPLGAWQGSGAGRMAQASRAVPWGRRGPPGSGHILGLMRGWPRVAPPAPLSLLLPGPGGLHVARAVPTARVSSDSGLPPRSVVRAPGLPGRRLLVPCSQWP